MHSRSQAFLLAESPVDPQKAWRAEGNPKLAFMCTSGRCTIAELWDGPGSEAYKFRLPKLDKDDDIHLTVIPMHRDKGE
jgi:hypothetical protein